MKLEAKELTPGFFPLADAAAWAGVSVRSIKRWIQDGLPYYQPCPRGRVLIKPHDIEQYLTRRQVPKSDLEQTVNQVMGELQRGKG